MDAIGAQELLFPALLPREPYEATGRWTEYGDSIFRLQDRKGADYLLGPTHEEMFTLVVKDLYSSYKDLPLALYQIQTKYRDEARPRAGLLRGREFIMKDAYSFDIDDAGLDAVVPAVPGRLPPDLRPARLRVRHRQGEVRRDGRLEVGGVPGQGRGRRGHLRAVHPLRLRRQRRGRPLRPAPAASAYDDAPAAHAEHTPDTPTIDTLVAYLDRGLPEARPALGRLRHAQERRLLVRHPDGTVEAIAIGLPGDREVDTEAARGELEPAWSSSPSARRTSQPSPTLSKGYIGPGASARRSPPASASSSTRAWSRAPPGSPGPTWPAATSSTSWSVATSAATASSTSPTYATATPARGATDGGVLESARGIEMGHIFQLGRKYADALGLQVLDENGKLVTVTMGSYGIGPSRAVAAIAEGTLDELGLCWPRNVAPADVHVVATGKDDAIFAAADRIATELSADGVTVLYDDRPKVSPGVKFKDAEMIGVPTIVVVGRNLAEGTVEVRDRRTGDRAEVPVGEAVNHLARLVMA